MDGLVLVFVDHFIVRVLFVVHRLGAKVSIFAGGQHLICIDRLEQQDLFIICAPVRAYGLSPVHKSVPS